MAQRYMFIQGSKILLYNASHRPCCWYKWRSAPNKLIIIWCQGVMGIFSDWTTFWKVSRMSKSYQSQMCLGQSDTKTTFSHIALPSTTTAGLPPLPFTAKESIFWYCLWSASIMPVTAGYSSIPVLWLWQCTKFEFCSCSLAVRFCYFFLLCESMLVVYYAAPEFVGCCK